MSYGHLRYAVVPELVSVVFAHSTPTMSKEVQNKFLFFNSLRKAFRGILPASMFPHQAHHQMILETPLGEVDG